MVKKVRDIDCTHLFTLPIPFVISDCGFFDKTTAKKHVKNYFKKLADVGVKIFNGSCTFDPPCTTKTGLVRTFRNKTTFMCHMVEQHGFDCMISEPSSTPRSSRAPSPVSNRQERQDRRSDRLTEMKRSYSDSSESDAPSSRQSSSSSDESRPEEDVDVPVKKMALVRRDPQPY